MADLSNIPYPIGSTGTQRDRPTKLRRPRADSLAMAGPDPVEVHVGNRLRLARKACALSQSDVGRVLGITAQQMQKYEKGVNRIGAGRLFRLAEYFGVSVAFFYDDMPTELQHRVSETLGSERHDLTRLEGLRLGAEHRNNQVMRLVSAFLRIPDSNFRADLVTFVSALRRSFSDKPGSSAD